MPIPCPAKGGLNAHTVEMASAGTPDKPRRSLPNFEPFKYRDFRLLWFGAMLSFVGTQIQGVAQGYWVFELTGDKSKLAFIMFAGMLPVSLLGPVMGAFADIWDRRKVITVAMALNAVGAISLAWGAFGGWLTYWHIVVVAVLNGLMLTVENPARQSIVRSVVPAHVLPTAVPTQAMTFNVARIIGPPLGGFIAAEFGTGWSFAANAASFSFLIFAALAIQTNLAPASREPQPIVDLIMDGMKYTFRHVTLRTLFYLECTTSFFGLFYLALMPAIAVDTLNLDEKGLGVALSFVGMGALTGILFLTSVSHLQLKPLINRIAMSCMAVGLVVLSFADRPALAYPVLFLLGGSTIVQFNTTNTLFQMIAPNKLRGRVLSLHMWAIAGIAPFGTLAFGYIAELTSLALALKIGGVCVGIGAILAWIYRSRVKEPTLAEWENG